MELTELSAAYVRPHYPPAPPSAASDRSLSAVSPARLLDDALLTWAELAPARVLNRPSAMAANNSKPFQAAQLRAAGFAVPDTLITTDPESARGFIDLHETVIYKSISGTRSIVAEVDRNELGRLDDLVCARPSSKPWWPAAMSGYTSSGMSSLPAGSNPRRPTTAS